MDQRELDSRIKALQKAISDKEPASNVISIMEALKNNVNPTEELLRVWRPFLKFRMHPDYNH
jgi:transcription elongation factor S-II